MQPERPIEKALRAAAKQRGERAGSDFQLHPATRRLLQNEVTRQYPAEAPSAFRWWVQPWSRLAWGLTGLAVLVVAGTVWLSFLPHERQQRLMAKNESFQKEAEQLSASAPSALPPAESAQQKSAAELRADTATTGRKQEEMSRLQQRSTVAEPPPLADTIRPGSLDSDTRAAPPPAAGAPSEASSAKPKSLPLLAANQPVSPSTGSGLKQELLAKSVDAEAAKQVPFAVPTTPVPAASNAKKTTFAQRFVRADRAALSKDSGPATDQLAMPILASFEVEQSGRELRVIDRDGSVYTGYVQDSAAASAVKGAARNLSAAFPRDPKAAASFQSNLQPARQTAANYFFQVVGTNRSLGQRVVFTGHLCMVGKTTLINGQVPAPGVSAPNSSGQPGEAKVPIQQILGTAVIGQDRTNEINAVPARPLPSNPTADEHR